ncbi:MAG: MFS transporter [Acidobacteria bacterium]|nr:MFS transporter [Acidobacteriota bacterium]
MEDGGHRQSGRFRTAAVAVVGSAHLVHDTYTAFLPPLIPELMRRLALSRAEAGSLTVFLQAPSLLQPLIGHLGDRRDLRWLVAAAPGLTALAMAWLPLAPGFPAAAALLLVAGLSSAALHALAPPIAGRMSGPALGRGMGFWMVGGELGRAVGPAVIVSGISLFGSRSSPWLALGGVLASIILFFRARRWPRVEEEEDRRGLGLAEGLRRLAPLLGPLAGLVFFRAFLLAAVTTYLPLFLRERGAGLWLSGAALTILEAAGVLGALLGGSVSDRVGRRRILAGSLAGASVLLVALSEFSGAARLAVLPALGFVALAATPVVMAVSQEVDPSRRSLANGVYMALSFTIRSLVVVAVGALADRFGMGPTYLGCAAAGLCGIPFALLLPRPPRQSG